MHEHDQDVAGGPGHGLHQLLWASTWPLADLTVGPSCSAHAAVPESVSYYLDAWPSGVHAPKRLVPCELEPGHVGDHLALGQAAALTTSPIRRPAELWLAWAPVGMPVGLGGVQIVETVPCRGRTAEDWITCRLPVEHPGRHSGVLGTVSQEETPPDQLNGDDPRVAWW